MTIADPTSTDAVYEMALRVRSKRDLERFLERLAEDYETNREVWENRSIPDFLTALADCSRRSEYAEERIHEPQKPADIYQQMACLMLGASVVR
jgi:hypothetical protein